MTSRRTDRPANAVSPARSACAAPRGSGKGGRRVALLIDDDRSVRMALTRYFERGGWDVRQADDGAEALELLADPAAPAFQLVITDLRMPGRTGIEVHDWLAGAGKAVRARCPRRDG